MECGEHQLQLLSNLRGLEEFGFGLETDNVKTEAVERKANTIMDQTKRPEVKGNPAYLLFFNYYLLFFLLLAGVFQKMIRTFAASALSRSSCTTNI